MSVAYIRPAIDKDFSVGQNKCINEPTGVVYRIGVVSFMTKLLLAIPVMSKIVTALLLG